MRMHRHARLGWLVLVVVVNAAMAEEVPDWVTRDALPAALQSKIPALCDGMFLEPAFPKDTEEDGSLRTRSDDVTYRVGEGGYLEGDVEIRYDALRLRTDSASLDEKTGEALLDGDVEFRRPGLLLEGARGRFNLNDRSAELRDARYVLYASGVHGSADVISYDGEHTLRVRRGRFTRCEPNAEAWALESRRLRIDEEKKRGTAVGAVLRLGGVPVFFVPYIRFPVTDERQSGFLVPEVGYSNDNGFDIALPYYFNLAPNYDATVTPRIMSKRGVLTEVELRDLTSFGHATVGGAYLPNDRQFNGRVSKDDLKFIDPTADFDPGDRWLVVLDQAARLGRMRTRVDYSSASDDDYFHDLGSGLSVSSQTALKRFEEVAYQRNDLQMRLYGESYQALEQDLDDSYRRIPALGVTYLHALGGTPLAVGVDAEIARFDSSGQDASGVDLVTGDRFHLVPRMTLGLERSFGHLRATVEELLTYYDLSDRPPGTKRSHERSLARSVVDGALVFERVGSHGWQTIEPRIYYEFTEYEDQDQLPLFDTSTFTFGFDQLFRDNPFTGLDRIQDANNFSAGLTSRLISADGFERLTLNVGQLFYLNDRKVTLTPGGREDDHSSPLAGGVAWRPAGRFLISSGLVYDVDSGDADEAGFAFRYTPPGRRVLNLAYRHRTPSLDQADISFYSPISRRLRLFGRWNYDVERSQTIEAFGGIEFDACCWKLRVLARRLLRSSTVQDEFQYDDGVFVQLILKGLAGIGGRTESVMGSGIPGYEELRDE